MVQCFAHTECSDVKSDTDRQSNVLSSKPLNQKLARFKESAELESSRDALSRILGSNILNVALLCLIKLILDLESF